MSAHIWASDSLQESRKRGNCSGLIELTIKIPKIIRNIYFRKRLEIHPGPPKWSKPSLSGCVWKSTECRLRISQATSASPRIHLERLMGRYDCLVKLNFVMKKIMLNLAYLALFPNTNLSRKVGFYLNLTQQRLRRSQEQPGVRIGFCPGQRLLQIPDVTLGCIVENPLSYSDWYWLIPCYGVSTCWG